MDLIEVEQEKDEWEKGPSFRWRVTVLGTESHKTVWAETEEEALKQAKFLVGEALVKMIGCDSWCCYDDGEG
jgi:hypothetical protein